MRLYLVRHAETDYNKVGRAMGQREDPPLNEGGVEQVLQLLPNLPRDVEVIYSSSLKRASETAEPIARALNLPIIFHPDIRERELGKISGMFWSDAERVFGKPWTELRSADIDPSYEVEGMDDLRDRVRRFVEYVKQNHKGNVMAVTHSGVIRRVYEILGKEKENPGNASIQVLEI